MALVSMRQLLDHAAENGYGLPAFNVNNLEQVQAIMQAADECNSPVIMQGSAGARKYAGEAFLRHLIDGGDRSLPAHSGGDAPGSRRFPGGVHQRHPLRLLQRDDGRLAEEDGKTPSSFEYNVEVTRKVVEMSHAVGVSVEGELGCLGSLESGHGEKEDGHGAEGVLTTDQLLTDPNEAAEFVKATGVDALAIAIGTSHGAYKFTRPPTGDVLAISRIKEIHARIPNTHLVMHGSSSVPQEWLKIINEFGGTMGQTYGVPVEEIVEGIKHGVRKVNIDTDLRMASTGAIRRYLAENTKDFDPRKFYAAATKAMKDICKARFEAFGSAGKADKIKPISLDAMASRYAKGELKAIVK